MSHAHNKGKRGQDYTGRVTSTEMLLLSQRRRQASQSYNWRSDPHQLRLLWCQKQVFFTFLTARAAVTTRSVSLRPTQYNHLAARRAASL